MTLCGRASSLLPPSTWAAGSSRSSAAERETQYLPLFFGAFPLRGPPSNLPPHYLSPLPSPIPPFSSPADPAQSLRLVKTLLPCAVLGAFFFYHLLPRFTFDNLAAALFMAVLLWGCDSLQQKTGSGSAYELLVPAGLRASLHKSLEPALKSLGHARRQFMKALNKPEGEGVAGAAVGLAGAAGLSIRAPAGGGGAAAPVTFLTPSPSGDAGYTGVLFLSGTGGGAAVGAAPAGAPSAAGSKDAAGV